MEKALRKKLIPVLLGRPGWEMSNNERRLFVNGFKKGGLAIHDPTVSVLEMHSISKSATAKLVKALVDGDDLDLL